MKTNSQKPKPLQHPSGFLSEMDRVSKRFQRRAMFAPLSMEGNPPMLVYRRPIPFKVEPKA